MHNYANENAEKEVISCALLDINAAIDAMDSAGIVPADFSSRLSRKAAEALVRHHQTGRQDIDILTLSDTMIDLGIPHSDNPMKWLEDCCIMGGKMSMLRWAAKEIRKEKDKRDLFARLQQTASSLNSADADPYMLAASLSADMAAVHEYSKPEEMSSAEELKMIRESYKKGVLTGVPTFFRGDKLGMLMPEKKNGDMIVLGGRSSDGKTTMMLNDIYADGISGIPCGVIEMEMSKTSLKERLASKHAAINPMWFRTNKWSDLIAKRFDEALDIVEKWPIHIQDERVVTIEDLIAKAYILKKKHGCRCLYIDYLQLLTPSSEDMKHGPRIFISMLTRRLKCLAGELNMPIYILSQLARTEDTKNSEVTPSMPTKEMLKESGTIEQDADVIMMVAKRPNMPRNQFTFMNDTWAMRVAIEKNRAGPVGMVDYTLFPSCYHLEEEGGEEIYRLKYSESKLERGW